MTPQTLLGRVFQAAATDRHRLAVAGLDGTATYAALADRVVRLTTALSQRGVGAGHRVAVVLPAGRDALAAALAVHGCGAAYVPIDPGLPPARISVMVRGTSARLVLDSAGQMDELAGGPWADPPPAAVPAPAVPPPADLDEVAYLIHTSGSTGAPKGIMVEHRGVLNLVAEVERVAPAPPAFRGSWWSSPSFDVAVWESWAPLMAGGTVVPVPESVRWEGTRFARWLLAVQVQSAYVPPAFLPDLRDALADQRTAALRRLLVGVEPIAMSLVQEILASCPGLRVVNGYGPAETTICCTLYPVPADVAAVGWVPIGKAVRGNRLYLLDEHGRPTAADRGELLVAGVGVARGYLGGTAADAARFGVEPAPPGARAYRTGDLVRRLPDGDLVFEGRVDRQLKIRGYRVDPEEVASAARATGTVRDVVVDQRELPDLGPVLVAYVVPDEPARFSERDLRAALARSLPAYAVPSAVIPLAALPMTRNGKVDYAALKRLAWHTGNGPGRVPAAGTPIEAVVLAAWSARLGPVELDDRFILAGGTSLGAVRVAAQLREQTRRDVSATEVLAAASARDLARLIESRPPMARVAPPAGASRGPLGANQLSVWLHERVAGDPRLYLEPVCFVLRGALDVDRLAAAVAAAADGHPAFGAVVWSGDDAGGADAGDAGGADAGTDDGPELVLHRHRIRLDTRRLDGGDARRWRRLVRAEAARPIDTDVGPLTRAVLFLVSDTEAVLLFVWHHLAVDGWSLRMFLADLARCYVEPGWVPSPAPWTICDLNRAEAARLGTPAERARLAAAAEALRPGAEAADRLPEAEPVGRHAATAPVELSGEAVAGLHVAAARRSVTLFVLLCAAYQRAVVRVLGLRRFLLGFAAAARGAPGADRVAGCLVNTVVVDAEPDPDATARPAVNRVAEQVCTALARQEDLPFVAVRNALRLGRAAPVDLVQIYLVVDEEPGLDLAGVECRFQPVVPVSAKFAVTMDVSLGADGGRVVLRHRTSVLPETVAHRLVSAFLAALDELRRPT